MQNAFKRAFTMAVAVTTILWSVAASFAFAPVASAATFASGDLVKGSLPAVYYIGSDMKRYVFTNDKAYKTWYADFSTVKVISDTDLASVTIGGNVTYKPGVKMIKIQSDPKVYAVAHGGVLRWVSTEAAAVALYGSNWNTKIDDISDAFFTNYTVGSQISSASDYNVANEQTMSPSINADKGLSGAGALNVTLASDNPAGMTVTKNAQGINLLKVNISGAGTVTGLTFTRQGAGIANDWANVYLYDGDSRLTTGRSVSSSTNQVAFSNMNLAISGAKELTLVGDLKGLTPGCDAASDCATVGNAHNFALVAATDVVASATVGGTFPVAGNTFSISGSVAGSLTIYKGSSVSDPKVGQTAAEIANFKLTAGSTEDVSVRRIVLTNSGAGQLANLANMTITSGGVAVSQNPIISGQTATFIFAVPYVLGKGVSRTFSVIADVSGANRPGIDTFKLYIDQTYDVYATGNVYGAGVNVAQGSPAFDSTIAVVNIQGGQITFAFNGPTTGDISIGANDAVLEKFAITSANHVEVRDLRVRLSSSADLDSSGAGATSLASITDCKIKNTDTGATVTNQVDLSGWTHYTDNTFVTTVAAGSDTTNRYFGHVFTDRFEIAAGQTMNLAVTCDVLSTAPTTLSTVSLTSTIVTRQTGDIRNLDSNQDVCAGGSCGTSDIVPTSSLTGNAQTVRASGLTVALASSPSSATVTKGSTVNALGINFTAGSASDVKVNQLKLNGFINLSADDVYGQTSTSVGTVASHPVQDVIQSVTIWDGTTQLGDSKSPDSTGGMNFTNLNWTVPAGTTKTVTVKVVVSNNVPFGTAHTNTSRFLVDLIGKTDATTDNVTALDKDSNTVTATSAAWTGSDVHLQAGTNDTTGSTITTTSATVISAVGSGTLTLSLDGDTPVASIVTANTTDNSTTRIKFNAVNEAFNVTRLTVADISVPTATTVAASTSARSITQVRLFDKNGTLFCSGALDSNSRLRCANDAGLFTVSGDQVVTIKVNIDQEGSGTTGANSGDAPVMSVYVDPSDSSFTDDLKVVGVSSGTALQDNAVGGGSLTVNSNADSSSTGGGVSTTAVYIAGNTSVIRKSQPTVATIATSTTLTTNPTVYKFSVTAASNGDIALKRFNLLMSRTAAISIGHYQVYENDVLLDTSLYSVLANASFSGIANGDGATTDGIAGTVDVKTTDLAQASTAEVITVDFTSERLVAAGTTKTYRLDAAIPNGATAGNSITHKLLDDSTESVVTARLNGDLGNGGTTDDNALNTANFVWSDVSADAHSSSLVTASGASLDWTNGKYVKTLPTQQQTLSL